MLKGDTVTYAACNSIKDTLDYDFATEKQFSYEGVSVDASVKHLAKFASDIWQIHPFCDTLECTLEELAVLELVSKNPFIKQTELVKETGKSLSTVKRLMESLQKKDISVGLMVRDMVNGKYWLVLAK